MTREEARTIIHCDLLEATAELACLEPADVEEIRIVKRYIEALEVAEEALQERMKGRWIYEEYLFNGVRVSRFRCSNCHKTESCKSDFCPNCGADNRESEG